MCFWKKSSQSLHQLVKCTTAVLSHCAIVRKNYHECQFVPDEVSVMKQLSYNLKFCRDFEYCFSKNSNYESPSSICDLQYVYIAYKAGNSNRTLLFRNTVQCLFFLLFKPVCTDVGIGLI